MNELWSGEPVLGFLAGFSLLLVCMVAMAAWRYFNVYKGWFFALLIGFAISSTGVIYATDWVVFIIFWEMVTVTTTLMLLWGERKIALQYFLVQFLGSNALFYAVLLALSLGYSSMAPISEGWLQNLFIAGLGMKCALLGLHFWLPPVHTRAPAPVSALLSGWTVNLGFIVLMRLLPEASPLLFFLGTAMIFYGGIGALLATDYKVLLAYSSISQLGYIAMGIGSGIFEGYLGAVFQMAAHGLAKTLLFIGSGYWEKECRGRMICRFETAFSRQKINAIATTIGFCSLMGVPLFAGYYSKSLVKSGMIASPSMAFLLYGGTLLTVLYAMRFLWWGVLKDWISPHSRGKISLLSCYYPLRLIDILPLLVGSAGLLVMGVRPTVIFSLMGLGGMAEAIFRFKEAGEGLLLLGAGLLIIMIFRGFRVRTRPTPSLDPYIDWTVRGLQGVSAKTFKVLFVSFQSQLAWIPVALLFLLLWITVFSGS